MVSGAPGASNPALILPSDLGGPRPAPLPPGLGRGPRLAPRLSSAGDKAGGPPPLPRFVLWIMNARPRGAPAPRPGIFHAFFWKRRLGGAKGGGSGGNVALLGSPGSHLIPAPSPAPCWSHREGAGGGASAHLKWGGGGRCAGSCPRHGDCLLGAGGAGLFGQVWGKCPPLPGWDAGGGAELGVRAGCQTSQQSPPLAPHPLIMGAG